MRHYKVSPARGCEPGGRRSDRRAGARLWPVPVSARRPSLPGARLWPAGRPPGGKREPSERKRIN